MTLDVVDGRRRSRADRRRARARHDARRRPAGRSRSARAAVGARHRRGGRAGDAAPPDDRAARAPEQLARRAADAARAPGRRCASRPTARARTSSACSTRSRRPVRRRSCSCSRSRPRRPKRRSRSPTSAMRTCGGAAFGGRSRPRALLPRRARADRDGADDRSGLRLHRPGAVRPGAVLMTRAARRRRRPVRPEGLGDLGDHPRLLRVAAAARSTSSFYSNYELQVDGARSTATIDIAWNSPLAWLDAQRRSGGTLPRHRHARHRPRPRLVPRRARRTARCARWPTCAAGRSPSARSDSPQATLIPLGRLRRQGLEPGRDVTVRRFDVLVGKHGDHVGGELDAFRCLERGEAAACAMLDLNWDGWTQDGTIDPTEFAIVADDRPLRSLRLHRPRRTSTPRRSGAGSRRCSRCATTIPAHREMMDLEGLKAWLPGRTTGFGAADRRGRSGTLLRPSQREP